MYIRNLFLIVFLVSCSSTIKDINYVTFDNTFSNGEKFVLLSCMSSYDKKIHISDFMVKELTSNINSSGLEFNKKIMASIKVNTQDGINMLTSMQMVPTNYISSNISNSQVENYKSAILRDFCIKLKE